MKWRHNTFGKSVASCHDVEIELKGLPLPRSSLKAVLSASRRPSVIMSEKIHMVNEQPCLAIGYRLSLTSSADAAVADKVLKMT